MVKRIDFTGYPIGTVLPLLLQDKSTKKNIIWATDPPFGVDDDITDKSQITMEQLKRVPDAIQPRIMKVLETQQERTKKKGEVFTPAWICNLMNNHCDEEWFQRKEVFNIQNENTWTPKTEPVAFPSGKKWTGYIDSRRLEITCGEAPYLVSRYDTSTGDYIEPAYRIGILDRKLRVVNENTEDEQEWFQWVLRAFQSVYGYEYQGDNLLLARGNLLLTFTEYYQERWGKQPEEKQLRTVANVIAWNIWQMDGLKDTVPFGKPYEEHHQITLFELMGIANPNEVPAVPCKIYDWRRGNSLLYSSLKSSARTDDNLNTTNDKRKTHEKID